jgi:hypothetical protein
MPKEEEEMWEEVQGRTVFADFLIQDTGGKVRQMTKMGYVQEYGVEGAVQILDLGKDLGDEVREARRLSVVE